MKNINRIFIGMTALLSAVILFSCNGNISSSNIISTNDTAKSKDTAIQQVRNQTLVSPDFDTSVVIDKNQFHIQLWIDSANHDDEYDEDSKNAFLLVQRNKEIFFSDSLFAAIAEVDLIDLNYDGALDLYILKGTGGRTANEFYNWILYNKTTHSFNRIKGIDSLSTVEQDSSGLLIAHALYGEHMNESYFFINKNYQLVDLKEEVETLEFDDTTNLSKITFDKALQKYRKQKDK